MMKANSWIDFAQLLILGLASPFFLFPSMKFIWILLIFPLFCIVRKLFKKSCIDRTIADWAVLILVIQVFLTCFVVDDLLLSLPKIMGILFGIAAFYTIAALLKNEKLIKIGIIVFLGSGLIFSVVSILGMLRKNVKQLDALADISSLIPKLSFKLPGAEEGFNPNPIGGILILIIPLYLILFFSYFRKNKQNFQIYQSTFLKVFLLIGILISCGVLLLTQSRASWIGLLLSCSLLLFPTRKAKKFGILLIVFFIVFYIMLVGLDKIPLSTEIEKMRFVSRVELWDFAVEIITEHPILGFGMNRIRQHPEVGYEMAHVHNHLLHTAAELGIPGLVAYLALLICMGIMCFEIWKNSKIGWMRIAILGLGCGQLAHFIFGLADSVPLGSKIGIFFWISLGLIAAMYNFREKGFEQDDPRKVSS